MARAALFIVAVLVVYFGGFVYDEVGPLVYAVVLTIIASMPLLLKMSFWKKIIFLVPLLVLRVIGKILLTVFGKNAISRLMQKYGLLEVRFNQTVAGLTANRDKAIARWRTMSSHSRAYIILIFLPVGIFLLLLAIVIRIIRLKFLQFIVEKIMQKYFMKISTKTRQKGQEGKSMDSSAD